MLFAASLTLLSAFALGLPWTRAVELRCWNLQRVGLVLGRGLLVGYALGLLTPSLRALPYALAFAVLAQLVLWIEGVLRTGLPVYLDRASFRPIDGLGCAIAVLLLALLFSKILADPLVGWDARSIWFFHAKILYFADHALDRTIWLTRSISFSHVDYPKLNAVWSALWMMHSDGWNEFLPKFSLLLLAAPTVLLCLGFSTEFATRALLLAALVFRMGSTLWDGYMDGLLACYAGLGVLYGVRFVLHGASLDLMTVSIALGMCAGLKNEGMAVAVCTLFFMSLGRLWQLRLAQKPLERPSRETVVTLVCAFLGTAIWIGWTKLAGITNDLVASDSKLDQIRDRLSDGHSLDQIWTALITSEEQSIIALVLATAIGYWLVNWQHFKRYRPALAFGICVPLAYLAILLLVYLTSPWDLTWHLKYSASRTRLTLHACFAMGLLGPLIAEARGPLAARHERTFRGLRSESRY